MMRSRQRCKLGYSDLSTNSICLHVPEPARKPVLRALAPNRIRKTHSEAVPLQGEAIEICMMDELQ